MAELNQPNETSVEAMDKPIVLEQEPIIESMDFEGESYYKVHLLPVGDFVYSMGKESKKFNFTREYLQKIADNFEFQKANGCEIPSTKSHPNSGLEAVETTVGFAVGTMQVNDLGLWAYTDVRNKDFDLKLKNKEVIKVSPRVEMTDFTFPNGQVMKAPYISHIAFTVFPRFSEQKPIEAINNLKDMVFGIFNGNNNELFMGETAFEFAHTKPEIIQSNKAVLTAVKPTEEDDMSEAKALELESKLAEFEQREANYKAQLEALEAANLRMKKAEFEARADSLVKANRIAANDKSRLVELYSKVDNQAYNFDNKSVSVVEEIEYLLNNAPMGITGVIEPVAVEKQDNKDVSPEKIKAFIAENPETFQTKGLDFSNPKDLDKAFELYADIAKTEIKGGE